MPDIPYVSGIRPELTATDGGRGSFSYADTSVHGPRQYRGFGFTLKRTFENGDLISEIWVPASGVIYPGTGGGAKIPGQRKFGSRAVGFSPNGAVLIRLSRIS